MNEIIKAAMTRYKTTLLLFVLIIMGGFIAYNEMPREAEPDVPIPMITVDIVYHGMSPEDSEKLLVKPLEKEIKSIQNIKEVTSTAFESGAHVLVEFKSGSDRSKSFTDVREAVNKAKQNLPKDMEEPDLQELSYSDRKPILNIMISGDVPESGLILLARKLQDKLESLKEVNRVDLTGDRDEQLEIIVSPEKFKTYSLDQQAVLSIVSANNALAPVGTLSSRNGQYTFKMPGTLKEIQDVYNTPVKVVGNKVVTFQDIAKIRRVHKDATSKAFFNGKEAVVLSIIKAQGANIIDSVDNVKNLVELFKGDLPTTVRIDFSENESVRVSSMIDDLQNNILSSILLVLIVIIAALGVRSAFLVGLAIPGAFLLGLVILHLMGITINIIVLFALIMSVGMLVDGAIVVTEYADMKLAEGYGKFQAYMEAVERMSWPIIASTATTLVAFIPLMFWPGLTGEFMKFLPITVVCTLSASLLMALVFVPTIGSLIGKKRNLSKRAEKNLKSIDKADFENIKGFEGFYYKILKQATISPFLSIAFICFVSFTIVNVYVNSEPKKLFFPDVEQRGANVLVRSKSDLSIFEKQDLVKKIEKKIMVNVDFMKNVESVYTKVGVNRDVIGDIRVRYVDWDMRKNGELVTKDLRSLLSDVSGVLVEIKEEKGGPSKGKKLQLNINGLNKDSLYSKIDPIINSLNKLPYLIEIEDNRPINGLQWEIDVDREKAAKYGASIFAISNYVQMITRGLKLGEFRPSDLSESIDIKIRYPEEMRTLDSLGDLLIKTERGMVPVEYFVTTKYAPKIEAITRVNGHEVIKVGANTIDGVGINEKLEEINSVIQNAIGGDEKVWVEYKGDVEKQAEASDFLKNAFLVVLVIMYFILILQFNKYHQGVIILSAIVFAAIGCLLLLHITNEPFGVVMGGIGIISLAGIVVNNNIVFIDTFNYKTDVEKKDSFVAVVETGVQRLRPVLLTTVTTILGLVPMAIQLNINLFSGELSWGSPASYWWAPLSMMVIGGLIFSTIITLLLTPCLLICFKKKYWLIEKIKDFINYFKKAEFKKK
jgi:multidrug efflux pump